MNGFIVVVRPYDDLALLPDLWLVHGLATKQRQAKFEQAFNSALAKCKQRDPDEWNIDDVRRELQGSRRWEITTLETGVSVTY